MLLKGKVALINVVSRAAECPQPMMTAHATSKAGFVNFTRSLVADIGPSMHPDILMNAFLPGPIAS
jgi:short-subunit dehydrogenase